MKVPAKFVPAAAVTRMEQVLFILTRCKGLEGGYLNFLWNAGSESFENNLNYITRIKETYKIFLM
jgi:hypothetical protein